MPSCQLNSICRLHDEITSSSGEEDDEDELMPLSDEFKPVARQPRISVSASVFGKWNQKQDFTPPQYPKSEALKLALKNKLESAFMFSSLNQNEFEIVLNAMHSVSKKAGEKVITQGTDGTHLYVVENG